MGEQGEARGPAWHALPAAEALARLGYQPAQVDEIIDYAVGRGTLKGAPAINHDSLVAKGFTAEKIEIVEQSERCNAQLSRGLRGEGDGAQPLFWRRPASLSQPPERAAP